MTTDDRIIRMVQIARGIEAGGHYNVSKLIWALAYAEQISASNTAGVLRGAELENALKALVDELKSSGASSSVTAALDKGIDAIHTDTPNRHSNIPAVFVSRRCGDVYVGTPPASTPCDDDPLDLREFRPYYYFDPMPIDTLLDALTSFPAVLKAQVDRLTEAQSTIAPAPGEWSLRELLVHLDVTQGLLLNRAHQFLAEDQPTLKGVAAWTMTQSSSMTTHDVLEHFTAARAETVDLLSALQPGDWWRTAYHEEFGPITLLDHVCYFTRHERSHVPQLMQIVRAATQS